MRKVESEKREYEKNDLVDIIKNLQRQVDDYYDKQKRYSQQMEDIKSYLTREIENTDKKLMQADWLTEQKKQRLSGHLSAYRKMLELLERER